MLIILLLHFIAHVIMRKNDLSSRAIKIHHGNERRITCKVHDIINSNAGKLLFPLALKNLINGRNHKAPLDVLTKVELEAKSLPEALFGHCSAHRKNSNSFRNACYSHRSLRHLALKEAEIVIVLISIYEIRKVHKRSRNTVS